ncbi:hypothetical protein TKK_0015265 [Trichogramma kaykai]
MRDKTSATGFSAPGRYLIEVVYCEMVACSLQSVKDTCSSSTNWCRGTEDLRVSGQQMCHGMCFIKRANAYHRGKGKSSGDSKFGVVIDQLTTLEVLK